LALFFVANLDSQVLGAAPSEDWRNQPKDEWPVPAEPPTPPSPYILVIISNKLEPKTILLL
jgi:hypothetical protein